MKQIKRTNLTFLCSVILGVVEMCLVALLSVNNVKLEIITSLILSQATIVIPGLVFLLISKESIEKQIPLRTIRFTSICLLIVFTQLCLPLVTAVNLLTQLFAKNAAAELSTEIMDIPILTSVLVIGFIGPLCEELFFRGVIFNSLKRFSGRVFLSAIVSAVFFGLLHMNANQCAYAFLLGIIFAVIDAVLDSVWPSVVCHVTINTQNVFLAYIVEKSIKSVSDTKSLAKASTSIDKTMLIMMALLFLGIALFTTVLAALLFVGICNNEDKYDNLVSIFKKKKIEDSDENVIAEENETPKIFPLTASGYIAIVICVYIMFLIEPTVKIIKMFIK